ncbi:hypothetical protein ABKN59_008788 [Abortiporus biennis]
MLEFMTIILSYLIHILFVSCIVWLEMKRMSQDPEFNPILDDLLRTDISLVFRLKTMKTTFWKNNRWFATRFNATHRIPYELWQVIFAYVQDDPQADMHFPFIISNICKYWRKIADDNPCLWARVHVDLGRNPSIYRLQELLRRSGTRHLNVRIYHTKLSTEKDEVLRAKKVIQLLLPHYNRISHFHVEVIFPDTLEGIIPLLSGTASELRTLSLTSCPQLFRWNFNGIRVWGPILHACVMKSPRIQDVTLTAAACFQSPFLLGFLALRSLTLLDYDQMACIVADPSYLLNTLQRMKELTYLRLDGVPTDSIEGFVGQLVPPTTIHALPKLQTLIVNKMPILFLRHLLSHMHAPSLTTISWTGIPHSIHSCYIFDVLSHNYAFPSLNTLRLAGCRMFYGRFGLSWTRLNQQWCCSTVALSEADVLGVILPGDVIRFGNQDDTGLTSRGFYDV